MILPVCQTCLRSGVLCQQCQQKIDDGEISSLDFELMKLLIELENSIPVIKNVSFQKSTGTDSLVVIQLSRKSVRLIGEQRGKITDELSKRLGRKVRIVEKSNKPKRIAEDLLQPVRVKGVNTIWLPDGTSEIIIRLLEEDREKLPVAENDLQTAFETLLGGYIRITFE